MTVLGTNNIKQVNRTVAEVFGLALVSRDNKWPLVFNEKNPTRKDEKTTIIKLDNTKTETTDGGAFTANDILEIGDYTVTQKIYKDKITLGDFSESFDNFGKIKAAAQEKGIDYSYQMDTLAADFLNNPTSTTAPYGFIVDGSSTKVPLTGDSQPIGNTGSTQDNLLTGGLSKANFNAAMIALVKQKRHNGDIAGYQPKRLVVPVDEWLTAWELTQSPGEPEGAERNRNFVNTLGIQLIVWDLLTDTNQVYLMASKQVMPQFIYYIKQRPRLKIIRAEANDNITYQFKMMLMAGVADYQGLIGIDG